MKLFLMLGAAALAVLSSRSANAADMATIGCVRDLLEPATVDGIMANTSKMVALQDFALDRALSDKVYEASRICQARFNWSKDSRNLAALYAIDTINFSGARNALRSDGDEPVRLEASFRALPDEIRESIVSGRSSKVAADKLVSILRENRIPLTDASRVQHVVIFVGMMVQVDHKRAAFASS